MPSSPPSINKLNKLFLWGIIGNRPIIDFLHKSATRGKLAHAYLFSGPTSLGKKTALFLFAKSILCQAAGINASEKPCNLCQSCKLFIKEMHPDVLFLHAADDKKNISIDEVRAFISRLNRSALLSPKKIGIITDAHALSHEAQAALLKFLEEPSAGTILLLHTEHRSRLSKTLISRLLQIQFNLVPNDFIIRALSEISSLSRTVQNEIAQSSDHRPGLGISLAQHPAEWESVRAKKKSLVRVYQESSFDRFQYIDAILPKSSSFTETQHALADTLVQILHFAHEYLVASVVAARNRQVIEWTRFIHLTVKLRSMINQNIEPRLILSLLLMHMPHGSQAAE